MHVIQKNFGPNYFFWSALKVPPSDFIKNTSQAPSKCLKQRIKVDELDYLGADEWKAKFESAYSFMSKYSKKTV